MPRIKFTRTGWSAVFGAFSLGDILDCGEAEARHFVVDAAAAEYVGGPVAEAEPEPPVAEQPAPRKRRAKE